MISVNGVQKAYGTNQVLNDVNFELKKGQIVGLLGRNGAGKSTLLNIITGYIPFDEGSVTLGGVDLAACPSKAKKNMGYLPELPPLYDNMTVKEYLEFVGKIKGVESKVLEANVEEVCEDLNISHMQNRLTRNLSKGYRQRVGFAQAMLGKPDILILDEPTSCLDPKQIVELREVIRKVAKDRLVFISSHIIGEIQEVCDRVLILHGGKIARDIGTDCDEDALHVKLSVTVKADKSGFEEMLSGMERVKSFKEMEPERWEITVEREADIRENLFDEIASRGYKLLEMYKVIGGLERTFLELTKN